MALARRRLSYSKYVGLVAGFACAVVAFAQVKSVDPYTVVVSSDKAELRCADLTQAYRVAQLASGTSLLVDGEGQTGLRVAYPAGASAFVRAEDADFDAASSTAKLNKGSKLRAAQFNGSFEFAKSWKGLLEQELPPGTELKVLETIKGTDGNSLAYRVEAPATARAFVSLSAVRKQDGSAVTKSVPKGEPKVATKPEKTSDPAAVQVSGTQAKTSATADKPATVTDASPAEQPTEQATTLNPAGTKPVTAKPVDKFEGLESAFRTVRLQSVETAEIEPLIAEYKVALAELPADSRRRPQILQRIEYLKFQQDLQTQKLKLADLQKQMDERSKSLTASIADVERTRVYTIIGMLLPSTVYDGKQLPLMYRIQSVGGVSPRTLGYLKPSEKLDIKNKLGLIVGVVGESSIDPSLQLNVVNPIRVDALKASVSPTGVTKLEVDQAPQATPAAPPATAPTTTEPGFAPIKKLDPEK